jgi:hypothetical protein
MVLLFLSHPYGFYTVLCFPIISTVTYQCWLDKKDGDKNEDILPRNYC